MLFINTRPTNRPSSPNFLKNLSVLGIETFALPLLEIEPCVLDGQAVQALARLEMGAYRCLVVVSPTACEFAFAHLSQTGLQKIQNLNKNNHLHIIAVGQATATALAQFDLTAKTPLLMSNEGMLQMPEITALKHGDGVLFWRGVGGRTLLSESLKNQGVQVDSIAFYQRICPKNLTQNTTKLLEILPSRDKIVLLISSEMAFYHWRTVADELSIAWQGFQYLALGERLTTLIAPHAPVMTVDNLDDSTLAERLKFLNS